MYDELVKRLRTSCESCKLWDGYKCCLKGECSAQTRLQAADAIEDLSAAVEGYESSTNMVLVEKDGETVIEFQPKWIPVTERLPEIHTMVLVMDKAHDMAVGSLEKLWDGEVWVCPFDDVEDEQCLVTHWMPLPEPPKEET